MRKSMVFSVAAVCVALLAGQGMALTTDINLTDADWAHQGYWSDFNKVNSTIIVGYYYSNVDTANGYVRFNLSALAPAPGFNLVVNSATFRALEAGGSNTFSDNLYAVADDSWTQGFTWANRPALGSLLFSGMHAAPYAMDMYSSAGLAAYIQQEATGDGVASICLKAGTDCLPPYNNQHQVYMLTTDRADRTKLVVDYDFVAVPEPATMTLLGLGAAGLFRSRKKA